MRPSFIFRTQIEDFVCWNLRAFWRNFQVQGPEMFMNLTFYAQKKKKKKDYNKKLYFWEQAEI